MITWISKKSSVFVLNVIHMQTKEKRIYSGHYPRMTLSITHRTSLVSEEHLLGHIKQKTKLAKTLWHRIRQKSLLTYVDGY